MAHVDLNHILMRMRADRQALTMAELLDLVDDAQGHEITSDVSAAHVEQFVDLLADKMLRDNPGAIVKGLLDAVQMLLGRTFGDAVAGAGGRGWMYGPGALLFAGCSRPMITLGLIARLADPVRIQQRDHPVCGPLVFMQSLCRTRPTEYVNLVTSLATAGEYRLDHLYVRPGANIRTMPYQGRMARVDYIALAGLRSSSALMGYSHMGNIQIIQGATVPSTVATWFRNAGFTDVRENTRGLKGWFERGLWRSARLWLGEEEITQSLESAEHLRSQGYVVVLMVHPSLANGFQSNHFDDNRATGTMNAFGGHWVYLEQVANTRSPNVTLQVSTWGQRYRALAVPKSKLVSWYWGYLAAKP